MGRSNRIRQPFREHSDCIRTTFEAPSNWTSGVIRAAIKLQSYMTFEVHSEYYDSILNIPSVFQSTFELHSRVNTLMQNVQESFDEGSQRLHSIRMAFLENSFENDIPARMWLQF